MLSYEERKAIENLKIEYEKLMKEDNILFPLYKSDAKRLIDIIEKQSKEIEELKEKNEHITKETVDFVNTHYISKDQIKAKIEELDIEIQCCEYADDDLEEYKQDMEKEKSRLLREKAILQSLLEKE